MPIMILIVETGISRYDEIIDDAEGQLDSVVTAINTVANPAAVTQAVTETRDEIIKTNNANMILFKQVSVATMKSSKTPKGSWTRS